MQLFFRALSIFLKNLKLLVKKYHFLEEFRILYNIRLIFKNLCYEVNLNEFLL